MKLATRPDRRFEFQKRGQLFIGSHNEPLSVIIAMRVSNRGLPLGIAREVWKRHS